MAIINSQGLTYEEALRLQRAGNIKPASEGGYGPIRWNDFYINLGLQDVWNSAGFTSGNATPEQLAAGLEPYKKQLSTQTVQSQFQIGGFGASPGVTYDKATMTPYQPPQPEPNITYPANPPNQITYQTAYQNNMATQPTTQVQPNPSNPWVGIPAAISGQFTNVQQAIDYWKNPQSTQPTSNIPTGATLISGPSGLQGLTESQIWREPNSANIYKLPSQPTMNTGGPSTGDLSLGGVNYEPPVPQANQINASYLAGITQDLENKRKAIDDAYKLQLKSIQDQMAASQVQIDQFNATQKGILDQAAPLTDPFRAQIEQQERQRLQVEQNYFANQQLVGELESLLTEGNLLVQQMQGVTGLSSIRNPRITETINGVNARVGVIEAVMNARSNQIAEAYRLIDRSISAITADRQDKLNYFTSLYNFYEGQKATETNKLIILTKNERDYIDSQISLLQSDLDNSEASAKYIKDLMVNPETAMFMAKAGVTLNDSVEAINMKMAKYSEVEKAQAKVEAEATQRQDYALDMMNKYGDAGIKPTDSYDQIKSKLSSSKIYQQATRLSGGGDGTPAVTGLKFNQDDVGRLLAVGFTAADLPLIQSDINDYGFETATNGMTDEQKRVIQNIIKRITPTQESEQDQANFLTVDFLKTSFANASIDSMLKAMNKERGEYSKFFQSKSTEEQKIRADFNNYLESGLMPIIEQYRNAGYTDKEILNLLK